MSDLQRIRARLETAQIERQQLDAEIQELQIAERVLLRYAQDETGDNCPVARRKGIKRRRLTKAKMTIVDVATAILRERGELHYREIADEAMKSRGYKGKEKSTPQKVQQSFWTTMKRKPDTFAAKGEGRFALKDGGKVTG